MPKFANAKEFRAAWIEALRSGNYTQGRQRLRRGDSFCCLGVACDILNPDGWREGDEPATGYIYRYDDNDPAAVSLPPGVLDQLGISSSFESSLIGLNDYQYAGFDRIATIIENNYETN